MAMAAGRAGPVSSPRRSREYWLAQVEAHARSGLSQVAFCRRRGLRKGTFSFWKWKLTRDAGARRGRRAALTLPPTEAPAFVPIQITAPRAAAAGTARRDGGGEIEITLGGARLVRVRGPVDPAWLMAVLRGVEALGC